MLLPLVMISVISIVSLVIGGVSGWLWLQERRRLSIMAQYDRGVASLQQGESKQAIRAFTQALQRQEDFDDARYGLGLAYLQAHRYQEGIATLELVVQAMPHNAVAYYNIGHAYILMSNLDQAQEALEMALTLNPNLKEIHFNLSRVFQERGNLEQAKVYCQNALNLDSSYAKAREYFHALERIRPKAAFNLDVIHQALHDFDTQDTEFMLQLSS